MSSKNGTRGGTATQAAPKQRPAKTLRIGALQAAIWRQESDRGPWYSVTFSRSYKTQSGQYQSSASFGQRDLLVVAKLADQAHTWICQEMAKNAVNGENGQEVEDEAGQPDEIPF